MKTKKPKTPAQERAAIRAQEERRLDRATETLTELLQKHGLNERLYDLSALTNILRHAIKTQHIFDQIYKEHKRATVQIPSNF